MNEFVFVAPLSSLSEGEGVIVDVHGKEVALFRLGDEVFALENECPHRGGPLGEGRVNADLITCPWHDWSFEIRTGLCTINPAAQVRKFPVRIEGDRVLVGVSGKPGV